ncbi:MAG: hypothetical protein K6T17_09505, partial [Fimbriimonadales bacterium]|nr:hypothetical protein [Fimbriimonadales bacterium]
SIPLISASVMSKKLAAGADHFVFDVKCGNGAFMREANLARELAQNLVNIATRSGKRATAFITDMSQPLASAVGNALEVEAAVEELKNGCQNRLGQVAKTLCLGALSISGIQAKIEDALSSGKALEVMARWIEAQGGNPKIVDNSRQHLPQAKVTLTVKAPRSGFVHHFNTAEIGSIARWLFTEGEEDRYGTGLRLTISLGDYVHEGDEIFIVHASNSSMAHRAEQGLLKSISISEEPVSPPPLIHAEVNP